MKLTLTNNNVVSLYKHSISSGITMNELESLVLETYSDENPNPVITKLPANILSLLIPETQDSVLIQGRQLIVGNQQIRQNSLGNTNKMLALLNKLHEKVDIPLEAYGFNFIFEYESTKTFKEMAKALKKAFNIKPQGDTVKKIGDYEVDYVLPKVIFKEGDNKLSLSFKAIIDNPQSVEIDKLQISVNNHFNMDTLPDQTELVGKYEEVFALTTSYIEEVLNQ